MVDKKIPFDMSDKKIPYVELFESFLKYMSLFDNEERTEKIKNGTISKLVLEEYEKSKNIKFNRVEISRFNCMVEYYFVW